MTQLSEHFALEEFQKDEAIPEECIPIFTRLAKEILEPARAYAGDTEFCITSGYRDPLSNAAAHGQPNSEHMASPHWCACDFTTHALVATREVFDWMRNNPALPFHQLILEHSANGGSVIHVSINDQKSGVRSVLEGATHNAAPYVAVDHVAYVPPQVPPLGVDEATQV